MMQYICHRKYRKKGASGKKYYIKKGKTFNSVGKFIVKDSELICAITSQDAYQYFARNDDNNGIQRGKLTYEIAFAPRRPDQKIGFRFTDKQREMIETEYPQFVRPDTDFLIFSYDFFNADIQPLRELSAKLKLPQNELEIDN